MNGITIILLAVAILAVSYVFYGGYIAKTWGIDPNAKTPATLYEDGVDFEPADTSVVFGHQFASIAGAGPINGPIQASIFGFVPVFLWCLFGGIFFGAVQDFAAMYASVKNKGHSMGVLIEDFIGKTGKKLFTLFCWLFCILVIAAFADIVSGTFNGFTAEGETVLANGSVASTSIFFIVAAIGLGIFLKRTRKGTLVNTIVAITLLVACITLGLSFPIYQSLGFWHITVFIYIFIASVTPVWLLLQPRDFLNSYLLIVMIVSAVVGIVVFNPSINLEAFNGFTVNGQFIFPTLFVTIACGAISGFHALISSGTSSKQIKNEKDMLPVSFGAMLIEVLLAIIALICVGYVGGFDGSMTPPQVFASAIGEFLTKLGISQDFSVTLILLAVSAFGLTSLDSVARIGRLSFQEFFMDSSKPVNEQTGIIKILTNKYFATFATLIFAYYLAKVGYLSIWPLFGSGNQLLGVLSLITCAVFLKRTKRKGFMLIAPTIAMLAITYSALTILIVNQLRNLANMTFGNALQLTFAVLLFGLGIVVSVLGFKKLTEKEDVSS